MGKLLRVTAVVGATAAVFLSSASTAAAQTSTIPTSEARDFLGEWTLSFDSEMGPFTLGLNVTDNAGQAAATLTSSFSGAEMTQTIEEISKAGNELVLEYTVDIQGQIAPIRLTLTPEAGAVRATLDAADGMFTTSGTATKAS